MTDRNVHEFYLCLCTDERDLDLTIESDEANFDAVKRLVVEALTEKVTP